MQALKNLYLIFSLRGVCFLVWGAIKSTFPCANIFHVAKILERGGYKV